MKPLCESGCGLRLADNAQVESLEGAEEEPCLEGAGAGAVVDAIFDCGRGLDVRRRKKGRGMGRTELVPRFFGLHADHADQRVRVTAEVLWERREALKRCEDEQVGGENAPSFHCA